MSVFRNDFFSYQLKKLQELNSISQIITKKNSIYQIDQHNKIYLIF
jgi:hypothetical protein